MKLQPLGNPPGFGGWKGLVQRRHAMRVQSLPRTRYGVVAPPAPPPPPGRLRPPANASAERSPASCAAGSPPSAASLPRVHRPGTGCGFPPSGTRSPDGAGSPWLGGQGRSGLHQQLGGGLIEADHREADHREADHREADHREADHREADGKQTTGEADHREADHWGSWGRPPGSRPPGSRPPGSRPPGSRPPGSRPPGGRPPGSRPPGSRPPGSRPPGSRPPGSRPPAVGDHGVQRTGPAHPSCDSMGATNSALTLGMHHSCFCYGLRAFLSRCRTL